MNEQLRNRIIECKNVGVHDNMPPELTAAQEEQVLRLRYQYVGRVRCGSVCANLETLRQRNPAAADFDDACCYFCSQNIGNLCERACDDRPESCDGAEICNESGIGIRPSYRALYLSEVERFECMDCGYEGELEDAWDTPGNGLVCAQCYHNAEEDIDTDQDRF